MSRTLDIECRLNDLSLSPITLPLLELVDILRAAEVRVDDIGKR